MKWILAILFSVIFCNCNTEVHKQPDIYWRDYTGIVPEDAIPGGSDVNHETTYIGQGFVKNYGVIPGMIYDGQKQMTVTCYGIKTIETYLKILCSSEPEAFKWITVKGNDFKKALGNKYAVVGGHEEGSKVTIGRVAFQGKVVVGKILSGKREKSSLYILHRGAEKLLNSYEMLIYDPSGHT